MVRGTQHTEETKQKMRDYHSKSKPDEREKIMNLPKIDLPTFELKIPSTGQVITCRPFTVKEEKILLLAAHSKDENDIIMATKQVVRNCILTDGINVDKVPFFDVDYIFITLRAKSVGENVEVNFKCEHVVREPDENNVPYTCGEVFPVKIDILNCEIQKNEEINNDIILGGGVRVKMKYPNYDVMKRNSSNEPLENIINIIAGSVDQVVKKDKVYSTKDFTHTEMKEFIENLIHGQYAKLEEFVRNFPSFTIKAAATCPKCNFNHDITYDDFTTFFL